MRNRSTTHPAAFTAATIAFLLALLSGCAAMVPDTFNKRLAGAYESVALIADSTLVLVQAGTITKAEGLRVQAFNDNALVSLGGVEILQRSDPEGATLGLTRITAALALLQTNLATLKVPK